MGKGGILHSGPAGSGKTTELADRLREWVEDNEVQQHQTIVVASAMHGARRLLTKRLKDLRFPREVGISVETLDQLALRIVNKSWRVLGAERPFIPFDSRLIRQPVRGNLPVSQICGKAALALNSESVRQMVERSCPVVVVDELQDCRSGKLRFLKGLNDAVPLLAAGDEFQQINMGAGGAPALTWAENVMEHRPLEAESHRTSIKSILNTASYLRTGSPTSGPFIFTVVLPDVKPLAAALKSCILKDWIRGSTVFLAHSRNQLVDEILEWLREKNSDAPNRRPVRINWIAGGEKRARQALEHLDTLIPGATINLSESVPLNCPPALQVAWARAVDHTRHRGKNLFEKTLLQEFLLEQLHHSWARGGSFARRSAMAIHSAKNQEWNNVFVLWSNRHFTAEATEDYKRRILYNAVTRARKNCVLLVHDPDKKALERDPFLTPLCVKK